jgi:protein-serine/threonine kinase
VLEEEPALQLPENKSPLPEPKRVITSSLATLGRAVSARIYFEDLYSFSAFPTALQGATTYGHGKGYLSMGMSEARKEDLRARWHQNETDYCMNSVATLMSVHS